MESYSIDRIEEGETHFSIDEPHSKVRKPYTITKQRERWTEDEHKKFLDALKLYGRSWRHIEEHVGTKNAVQIRSHAQKFFTKLEKGASSGTNSTMTDQYLEIPPPRPKRKPGHPYPKKTGAIDRGGEASIAEEDSRTRGCEVSYSSAANLHGKRECSKVTELAQDNSESRPLYKPKMIQGTSQPSRMSTSLKLFGQTLFVQNSFTDDFLFASMENEAVCSEIYAENKDAPCEDEILDSGQIRKDAFSPEESETDTFQSVSNSTGRSTIHNTTVCNNTNWSSPLLNSCHSNSSEDEKIQCSYPQVLRDGGLEDGLQQKPEVSGMKCNYTNQSQQEDEKQRNEALMQLQDKVGLQPRHWDLNSGEIISDVSHNYKMPDDSGNIVLQSNRSPTTLMEDCSFKMASASHSNYGDPPKEECSVTFHHSETSVDSILEFQILQEMSSIGFRRHIQKIENDVLPSSRAENRTYSGAGFVPYKKFQKDGQYPRESDTEQCNL